MPATRTKIYQQLITRKVPIANSTTRRSAGLKRTCRWLIKILPAEAVALLASEATYHDLPRGTIMEHGIGDGQFADGIFIGLPETEQYELKINYRKLPSDLRDWISTASGVSVTIGSDTFWVSSVWIISTDEGDASLDPSEFTVRFIGVHRHQANATYTLTDEDGPIQIDLTLDHIGKAVAEAISIEAFRSYVLDTYNAWLVRASTLFQVVYEVAGHNRIYGLAQHGNASHWAWLLPVRILYEALAEQLTSMTMLYMRTTDSEVDPTWARAGAGWMNDGRPLAISWAMYKQLYDGSRDVGTALSMSGYDVHCVAVVSDAASPADMTSTGANWIGGQLGGTSVGRGDDSLFEFGNCYELLQVIAENHGEKHLPTIVYQPLTNVYSILTEVCLLTADTRSTGVPWAYIKPGSLLPSWKWQPNERDLRGCEIEVPGATGDDQRSVEFYGAVRGKPHTLTAIMHNAPTIADAHSRVGDATATIVGSEVIVNAEGMPINSSIATVYRLGFDTRGLYYLDTPSFATKQIAIRVHSACDYNYGLGSSGPLPDVRRVSLSPAYAGMQYPSLPDAGPYTATTKPAYVTAVFARLLAMLVEDQRSINMLSAICRGVVRLFARNSGAFGNPNGTALLSGTLIGNWPASLVGRRLVLESTTDGFTEARTDTTLWDTDPTQRNIIITRATPNDVQGTTEIEGIGLDDSAFWETP